MLHLCPNPARRHPTLPDERVLHDASLSLAAVGLLTKLMNAPTDSSTDPQTLAARCGTGRDAVKNAIRELSAAGLLLRTVVRQPGGRLHTVTLICDDPALLLTELTRLNTGGLVNGTAPARNMADIGQRPSPRHARQAAPDRVHADEGSGVAGCPPAVEHGEHYHHCVLRTTHVYIRSHAGRDAVSQHVSADFARSAQAD